MAFIGLENHGLSNLIHGTLAQFHDQNKPDLPNNLGPYWALSSCSQQVFDVTFRPLS